MFFITKSFVTLNQGDVKVASAVALSSPCKHNNLPRRSFASLDMASKYSVGKQKSHFNILAVVSSTESSRNGDTPLKRKNVISESILSLTIAIDKNKMI